MRGRYTRSVFGEETARQRRSILGTPKLDAEALSRQFAELGFDLPPAEIEKLAPRIEIGRAALEAVRVIDLSGCEPATVFAPRLPEEGSLGG